MSQPEYFDILLLGSGRAASNLGPALSNVPPRSAVSIRAAASAT
jgi:hypothetical protein